MKKEELRKIIKEEISKVLNEEIKIGDKVKYLEKPVQHVDYYFEYGPKEVVKVNKTTVLINLGLKDDSHPKGPKFSKMNRQINKDRIFPYSGYKKSSMGKKDGKQMWVKK